MYQPTGAGRYHWQWQLAVIVLAGLCSYANTFNVPMLFDDVATINAALANVARGGLGLTQPGASRWVTDVTFVLNHHLHGVLVFGYHVLNLLIHLATALIAYVMLSQLVVTCRTQHSAGEQFSFIQSFVPFGAALFFVCHPIQTEAVTYISQRYTSLAALFYLMALYAYLRVRRRSIQPEVTAWGGAAVWWGAFVLCAVLAMKSKQTSMTLPLVTVMLEMVCYRGKLLKKPLFLLVLAALLLVVPCQEIAARSFNKSHSVAQLVHQASAETDTISRTSYFLTQQCVGATYLRLLVLPINQNLDYDYPVYSRLVGKPFVALVGHLMLIGLAVLMLVRSQDVAALSNSDCRVALQLAALGIGWFYLTLAVESTVIPIRDVIFEHRLYVPSLGIFVTIMAVGGWIVTSRKWLQKWLLGALVLLAVTLTVVTAFRNRIWNSELSLWQDALKKSPEKARVLTNAGLFYGKQRLFVPAVQNLVRAIEREPQNDKPRLYLNHTVIRLAGTENKVESGYDYQAGQESVDPAHYEQWFAVSANNLGVAYELLNKPALAKKSYFEAVSHNPSLARAWYNLALLAVNNRDAEGYQQAAGRLQLLNSYLWQALPKEVLR